MYAGVPAGGGRRGRARGTTVPRADDRDAAPVPFGESSEVDSHFSQFLQNHALR